MAAATMSSAAMMMTDTDASATSTVTESKKTPSSANAPSSAAAGSTTASVVTFDLEAYAGRYAANSETRLQRLLFIAERAGLPENGGRMDIAQQALKLAEQQMKSTGNVRRYKEVFGGGVASVGNAAPAIAAQPQQPNSQMDPEVAPIGSLNNESNAMASSSAAAASSGEAPSTAATETKPPTATTAATSTSTSSAPIITYDAAWVQDTEASNFAQLEMLEGRLSSAQAQINKEAIRTGYLALADFYRPRGEPREALRAVLRSRDYCTSRSQTAHVCLLVMELAMDVHNSQQVHDYVTKAEHSTIPGDASFPVKLKVADGLAYLAEGNFAQAAEKLTRLGAATDGEDASAAAAENNNNASGPSSSSSSWTTLCSPEDVALYGALVGLASLHRNALVAILEQTPQQQQQQQSSSSSSAGGSSSSSRNNMATPAAAAAATVAGSASFELVPSIRDVLRSYSRADYKTCLRLLNDDELQFQLRMDMHLAPHLDALMEQILHKCLVEYVRPYSRVSLKDMASQFFHHGGSGMMSGLGRRGGDKQPSELDQLMTILAQLIGNNHSNPNVANSGGASGSGNSSRMMMSIPNYRINCATLCLEREPPAVPAKLATQRKLVALQDRVLNDAHALMIRLSCLECDVSVERNSSRSRYYGGGGGGGGSGAMMMGEGGSAMIGGGGIPSGESSDEDEPMMIDNVGNPEDGGF